MLRGNLAGKVTKGDRFMAHNGTFDAPPNLKETVPEKADFLQWLEVAPAEQKGGWPTGFEPATSGITIRGSAIELRPPSARGEYLREGRGRVKQRKLGVEESGFKDELGQLCGWVR